MPPTIGPNNSGKTSALQALALWELGLRRWTERRSSDEAPEKRPGVAINRRDLISVPVPNAELLWRNRRVQDIETVEGKRQTQKVRIDIVVEGITEDQAWRCGFEFDYANEESFYCRPLRLSEDRRAERMPVPPAAARVRMAYLPPLSGLAANETRLDPGAIDVRIGEGRTAEVLRNLCYRIATERAAREEWEKLVERVHEQFRVTLDEPRYIAERGEIAMSYRDVGGARLDLSSAGRGLQQILLLLAYLQANPGAVLLLDEPDAHLEILRQRQIYQLVTAVAREQGSQVIAASHSEIVLGEAAGRDVVIAFVGNPHRVGDRTSQVLKALKDIPFDQYYQAEQQGSIWRARRISPSSRPSPGAWDIGSPPLWSGHSFTTWRTSLRPRAATSTGYVKLGPTSWGWRFSTGSRPRWRRVPGSTKSSGGGASSRTTSASQRSSTLTPAQARKLTCPGRSSLRRSARNGGGSCGSASRIWFRESRCGIAPTAGSADRPRGAGEPRPDRRRRGTRPRALILHSVRTLDRVIEEYREYLLTEFRAKDPTLKAALERELDRPPNRSAPSRAIRATRPLMTMARLNVTWTP